MNFRWLVLILGLVAALFFVSPSSARADLVEDLRKSIDQKNEEIRQLEERAKKFKDEIASKKQIGRTLQGELTRINSTVKKLQNDIAITEKKIQRVGLEIRQAKSEISEKEASVQRMKMGLVGLIQVLSEQDKQSPLGILVQHSNLSAFFHQVDSNNIVQRKLVESVETLRDLQGELKTKKARAEDKKEELEDLEGSLQDNKKINEEVKQEKNDLLQRTKNQEKSFQKLLDENEEKQEKILKEIEDMEEALRKLIDPTSLPKTASGFFQWPAEGRISQGYGETPFTKSRRGRDFYSFHNGIDIAEDVGTPVKAVEKGVVKAVGDTDRYCYRGAYGKFIVIDHRNGLATMYAHLSAIKVKTGQEVNRGDLIAYMGSTGLVTGPHLHFTVYDSKNISIKTVGSGVCGPLPVGGSVNPLRYLTGTP